MLEAAALPGSRRGSSRSWPSQPSDPTQPGPGRFETDYFGDASPHTSPTDPGVAPLCTRPSVAQAGNGDHQHAIVPAVSVFLEVEPVRMYCPGICRSSTDFLIAPHIFGASCHSSKRLGRSPSNNLDGMVLATDRYCSLRSSSWNSMKLADCCFAAVVFAAFGPGD